jgi:mannitol/fructose-specific phosphotransferase system IIA component (Ntr-type)
MTLAEFTSPELIIPELRSRDASGVIAELCSLLQRQGRVTDLLSFYNSAISRELLSSTATSTGWAVPHARLTELSEISFALGRTAEPMLWSDGTNRVQIVFLFAVPQNEVGTYLRVVSGLARLSQNPARMQRLLTAPDANGMLEELKVVLREPSTAALRVGG